MCIKLISKTLNPKAQEWRPAPKHHQPPLAAAPLPPPLLIPRYYPLGFINAFHRERFFKSALMAAKSDKKMEGEVIVKRPKSPRCNGVVSRRGFPPRIRRLFMRAEEMPPPPPRVKQEWRPRRSAAADGGAVRSPPCDGYDRGRRFSSRPEMTTVMIKNIPNQLRRDFMLKFLDGFSKTYHLEYDFMYLPMDFSSKDNLGYAFVNFTTSTYALKFKKILQNFKWGTFHSEGRTFFSKKVCDITWARIQGKQSLINRFQKTCFCCDKPDFLPVVFDPPRNGSDPNHPAPVTLGSLHGVGIKAVKKVD